MTQTPVSSSILLKNKTKQNFAMKFPGINNPFPILTVALFKKTKTKPVHKNVMALIYMIVFYITKIAMLYA